jgi:hypothetical protein
VTSRSRREEILRQRWLEVLRAELAHREEGEESGALREQRIAEFQAQLDVIAVRLRADPNYVEATEAQKAQWGRELDAYFRQRAAKSH